MGKRQIKADQIVTDIGAGMDDEGLMHKYELSPQALLKAMTKLVWDGLMPPSGLARRKSLIKGVLKGRQRRIVAKEVVQDLRSGMQEPALMEKYRLSPKGCQRLLERLVDSGVISHSELYEISESYRSKIDGFNGRRHNRAYLTVPLPIYDTQSFASGLLRDISREGFRVVGMDATVGEVKTFEIPLDIFMQADPLLVVGECRWVARRGQDKKYIVAGYKMTNFSVDDENAVRKFITSLLFTESGEWQTMR
jgi:hypothetical protein